MKYTRKDIAGKFKISTQAVDKYLKSGHLIEEDHFIDSENPQNKSFLRTREATQRKADSSKDIKGRPTRADLELLKLAQQTKLLKLKEDKERGALINQRLVSVFLGKLHTIDANEFKNLGYAVSGLVYGALELKDESKIPMVTKIINDEVVKILETKKRLIKDWLEKYKIEKNNESS